MFTDTNKYNSKDLLGSLIYRNELEEILKKKYNSLVSIVENRDTFYLSNRYIFRRPIKRGYKTFQHEFSAYLWEIIYTNILMKNSEYRNITVLDLYTEEKDVINRNLDTNNKDVSIKLLLSDGRNFLFKPDFYDKTTKTFTHYFDQSYYDNDKESIIIETIKRLFNNKECAYNFIIYKDSCRERCDFF